MDNGKEKEKPTEVIALSYDKDEKVPAIIAKGSGHVAEKILDIANKSNIPVYNDSQIINNLNRFNIGDFIPPEMFEIIAQVYIFVDKIEKIMEDIDI